MANWTSSHHQPPQFFAMDSSFESSRLVPSDQVSKADNRPSSFSSNSPAAERIGSNRRRGWTQSSAQPLPRRRSPGRRPGRDTHNRIARRDLHPRRSRAQAASTQREPPRATVKASLSCGTTPPRKSRRRRGATSPPRRTRHIEAPRWGRGGSRPDRAALHGGTPVGLGTAWSRFGFCIRLGVDKAVESDRWSGGDWSWTTSAQTELRSRFTKKALDFKNISFMDRLNLSDLIREPVILTNGWHSTLCKWNSLQMHRDPIIRAGPSILFIFWFRSSLLASVLFLKSINKKPYLKKKN